MLLPGALKRLSLLISIVMIAAFSWYYFFYTPATNNQLPATIQSSIPQLPSSPAPQPTNPPVPQLPDPTKKNLIVPLAETPMPPLTPPAKIKAIYVTAQTASLTSRMNTLFSLADNSEINAFVINIKDGDETFFTPWMASAVRQLRSKGLYPIARVMVFQDNHLAKSRLDLALKKADGTLWGKKGYNWVDPASREVWDYNLKIARKALDMGFVEINLDYIRFPDGDIDKIIYPAYDGAVTKAKVVNDFSQYFTSELKKTHPDAVVSADVFAYIFLRDNDLGIGQRLVDLAQYYDVIAPMIYPSHYSTGNFGFTNPATEPYEVARQTLQIGLFQLLNHERTNAKIRPWIQDFDMGAAYGRDQIVAQLQGLRDSGLAAEECSAGAVCGDGWMVWNPSNIYNQDEFQDIESALLPYPRS